MKYCHGIDEKASDHRLLFVHGMFAAFVLLCILMLLFFFVYFIVGYIRGDCSIGLLLFGLTLIFISVLASVPFLEYSMWLVQRYCLTDNEIVVKAAFCEAKIQWDKVQRVGVYTVNRMKYSFPRRYLIMFLSDENEVFYVPDLWTCYTKRKNFFLVRYTDERYRELQSIWKKEVTVGLWPGQG